MAWGTTGVPTLEDSGTKGPPDPGGHVEPLPVAETGSPGTTASSAIDASNGTDASPPLRPVQQQQPPWGWANQSDQVAATQIAARQRQDSAAIAALLNQSALPLRVESDRGQAGTSVGEINSAIATIRANLAANLTENRAVAEGLFVATRIKIAELRDARLNDDETADVIEFLEWLAQGLTTLRENLDRAIANPSEPMFLGTAGEIVQILRRGLLEAAEKNRCRIWEMGACVGTACFLNWLGGENLAHFLSILFQGK